MVRKIVILRGIEERMASLTPQQAADLALKQASEKGWIILNATTSYYHWQSPRAWVLTIIIEKEKDDDEGRDS